VRNHESVDKLEDELRDQLFNQLHKDFVGLGLEDLTAVLDRPGWPG
jgi:hypothetical protein